jgi:hypothetical protein
MIAPRNHERPDERPAGPFNLPPAPLTKRANGAVALAVEECEAEIYALLSLARGGAVQSNIRCVSGELSIDAVGLWQMAPAGRSEFELSGDDLTEFVRRCVAELLAHGAKPVVGGGAAYDWIYQPQYGGTSSEILDAVMNEWPAAGSSDRDAGGLWFALPSPSVGNRE